MAARNCKGSGAAHRVSFPAAHRSVMLDAEQRAEGIIVRERERQREREFICQVKDSNSYHLLQ